MGDETLSEIVGRLETAAKALTEAEGSASAPEIARAALKVHTVCRDVMAHSEAARTRSARSLASQGLGLKEIGAALGISKQRAHQLLKRG